ncbi:MAG TPA: hypothetical protein VIM07_03325 [Chitinophagaceae bacterium]
MKKDKNLPVSKKIKSGPGSDPINKFKKGKTTTAAEIDNIIKGAVGSVKGKSGRGLANKGTNVDYNDEQ